ncbi:hypothetical protein BpJC7_01310 [Weizmannia acidilactici]|uniref:Uncharacterized protein n=1 Tax=Weizmannia acidilactici TaxID=2607726 RepID=A0A5J4JER1_9BACI|nr:CDP-glycerol glycerophosphotransferase family protein [Weizmannia acidilactici]GER68828.1 hypothetical protein BpJC7_01310 [Weizmannia acidilactici]GER72887.1 hypothetical protein BpPP18_09540 [Weizmannia acidilactici]
MVRELFISLYLLLFRIIFSICNLFPIERKVSFVVSFKSNSEYVYHAIKQYPNPFTVVFLCTSSCFHQLNDELAQEEVLLFNLKKPFDFFKSIYHLATSRYIVVDNYYGFLAATNFKKEVECIQVWHAAGAFKTFGLKDKSINTRTKGAITRFKKVYSQFHKIVIGSDIMQSIFKEAFGVGSDNFLCTGVPRTDLFFDDLLKEQTIRKIYQKHSGLMHKKIILYAPTFRDYELNNFSLKLDLALMSQELKDDYVVIIKLHPVVKNKKALADYKGFILDFSHYDDINELLLITDILITDYSSIPFEFSLLKRPMIFYPYDLKSYQENRGFWKEYEQLVPGPIAFNTEEIIRLIKENDFDMERIVEFSTQWNKYSDGKSSYNLTNYLYQHSEDPAVGRS